MNIINDEKEEKTSVQPFLTMEYLFIGDSDFNQNK